MESTIAFLWQRCDKVTGIASYDFRIFGNDFRKNGSGYKVSYKVNIDHFRESTKMVVKVKKSQLNSVFCNKLTKSTVIFTIFAIFVTQLGTSKTQRATQPSREAGYLGGVLNSKSIYKLGLSAITPSKWGPLALKREKILI